ncbi:MAG: FGGY-family carbohydrate kinase [Myxococcota bacterium]
MSILAIDLGTSNVKAAVVRLDGTLVGTGRAAIETTFTDDGGAEQDPDRVWESVLDACKQALSPLPDRGDVAAVACASQYSSIVPVDREGRPTANMVAWMDQRGAPDRLVKLPGGKGMKPNPLQMLRWIQVHSIPPRSSGSDSLAHMRWFKLARPEVYERTATFLEPMDFVTARFTGRRVGNYCSTFLMLVTDNRSSRVSYHPTLLEWSGIDREKLPELVPMNQPIATLLPDVADRLGLSHETVVFPGINDTQAGGLGSYAFSGNHTGISIGTTGVCITHVDFKKTDIRNSIATMPCPIDGKNFVMAEAGTGGQAVEHFLERIIFANDSFGRSDLAEKFAALEKAINSTEPGSDGLLFLPWLTGSITPAADGHVRGGFLNISLQTTREHMARAVLEGVALNLRWVLDRVDRFAKRKSSYVVFYGGGAVSGLWSQILADVMKVPVHQVHEPEYAPSRGIALHAFERLGLLELDQIRERVPIAAIHEPRAEFAPRYDAMFKQFVRVFRKNRDVFRALNVGR